LRSAIRPNEDRGELSIVDLETGAVLRTVDVAASPKAVASDRATVYVTSGAITR
jgi:hypothetical protein